MNKIDDILERLKGQQPVIDDPDTLTDRIMDSLPDLEPSETPQRSARVVSMRRRWMAVAASILILIGVGTVLMKESVVGRQESVVSRQESVVSSQKSVVSRDTHISAQPSSSDRLQGNLSASHRSQGNRSVSDRSQGNSLPRPLMPANDLHYAALVATADSLSYQDPARMDEFIAKMADYNQVEAVPMDCMPGDSMAVGKAYVFDDNQEQDLFSRLLQAACWYDSKTPGYLLNFSHQQFFFTLKDLRKGEKYLWIAERIVGGRILLFSSHSPIEAEVSSACYQKYREQLTHTNFSTLQF